MVVPDGQTNGHSNGNAGAEPQRAPGLSFAGIAAARGRPRPSLSVHGPAAAARREAISGFGEASQAPAAVPDKPVIPKIENTFVVGRPSDRGRQRNRFIPDRADAAPVAVEERFEVAVEEVAGPVTYGLSLAVSKTEVITAAGRDGSPGAGPSDAAANGGGAAIGGALSVTSRDWEARKLREDLPRLADDPDLDQYEAMPVEMFGEAMLRGMGWEAGKGVGRNNVVVVPKEYVPRPGRLGLGAEPAALLTKEKKYIKGRDCEPRLFLQATVEKFVANLTACKPGESREAKPDMVYLDADGNQRYTKGVDEKLVARQRRGAAPGKSMYIEGGRHSGFFCSVLAVEPEIGGRPTTATVRLQRSDTTVTVRCSDLIETSEAKASREAEAVRKRDAAREAARQDRAEDRREGQPGAVPPERNGGRGDGAANGHVEGEADRKTARKEAKREAKKERRRDKESKMERQRDDDPQPSQKRRRSQEASPAALADPPWLAGEIRVRIVDKGLRGGALYLKKGVVADVHQPTVCDVIVDGARVSNVSQAQLETVIPKEGGKVLVLAGPHAREVGRVMHKAKGAAAVQLLTDHSVLKVVYEDISEYLGQDHD